jgi:predicted HNH restriction endonuclease
MATWISDIVTALSNLGGAASYEDICAEIKRIRGNSLPTSWRNIIQRTIQEHASESRGFKGKAIFYSTDGKGAGVWGLLPISNSSVEDSISLAGSPDIHGATIDVDEKFTRPRNQAWSRDELILALQLYLHNRKSPPGKDSVEVIQLSEFLNKMGSVLGITSGGTFRNANGVYMKLMNFRRFDPNYTADGRVGLTRGNKDEELVWREFSGDMDRLLKVVTAIRQAVECSPSTLNGGDDEPGTEEAEEGRVLTRIHRTRERKRGLVEQRKKMALKIHGHLTCEACGFNFSIKYGEIGQGLIEVHHTKPLHTLMEGDKTKLEDLALLCANCHRVVHSSRRWLTIDQVRAAVKDAQGGR